MVTLARTVGRGGLMVVGLIAACGPGQRPVAPPVVAPAPTPLAAPAVVAPLPAPLAAVAAPCPDGDDDCVAVTMPAAGYLVVVGTTPHYLGCASFDDGVIAATVDGDVVTLAMTSPVGELVGSGQCRALAIVRGRATIGPLAAGRWVLRPIAPDPDHADNLAPLSIDALTFAPAAP